MPALPARRPAPTLSGAHSPGAPKLVLSGPEDPVEVFVRIPSGDPQWGGSVRVAGQGAGATDASGFWLTWEGTVARESCSSGSCSPAPRTC